MARALLGNLERSVSEGNGSVGVEAVALGGHFVVSFESSGAVDLGQLARVG